MEKTYRIMKSIGEGSIALGVIVLVTGIAAGVLSIVNGARLLKNNKEIMF